MELSTCRPGGMGLSPVPYTAIVQYADEETVLDRFRFRALIRRMDHEVLARHREEMERQKNAPPPNPRKGRR